ncbi:MAG: superoxide dismutase family protein, partial [Cyanobacteria bacterium P01_H01_bin.153]
DETGNATVPVLAPRLTIEMVKGRSLIVHRNGDNFSDDPKPLGGGGPRLACGVID